MPLFTPGQKFDDFLKDYYSVGPNGYFKALRQMGENGPAEVEDIKKILTADESNYYLQTYAAQVQYYGSFFTELYKLLDKRPITEVGDSFKYTAAHNLVTTGIGPGGATDIFADAPTEPAVSVIDNIMSPVQKITLQRDLHSMIRESLPANKIANSGSNWQWITQNLAPQALFDKIDTWLGGYEIAANVHGVDTVAGINIDCIDRMVSNKTESGAADHVSLATDGDIYWDGAGTGSIKIDRSSATTWDAQIKLPTVAGTTEAWRILDELDDLIAVAKRYSERKRYIIITTPAMLNMIQEEINPQGRYLEDTVDVTYGINGIETRPGHTAGFEVSAIKSNGIKMPVFASSALPTKNSVYTTATAGHLYALDLDHIFIRVDMPVTYLETGFGVEMLHQSYTRSRAMLFTVSNLVCDKFACHAALKWTPV